MGEKENYINLRKKVKARLKKEKKKDLLKRTEEALAQKIIGKGLSS